MRRPPATARAPPGTNQTLCGLALSRAPPGTVPPRALRDVWPSRAVRDGGGPHLCPRCLAATGVRPVRRWSGVDPRPTLGSSVRGQPQCPRRRARAHRRPAGRRDRGRRGARGVYPRCDGTRRCGARPMRPAPRPGSRPFTAPRPSPARGSRSQLVRDVARGAETFPDDAAGRTALGVLRAHARGRGVAGGLGAVAAAGARVVARGGGRRVWSRTRRSAAPGSPARSRARARTCSPGPERRCPHRTPSELPGRLDRAGRYCSRRRRRYPPSSSPGWRTRSSPTPRPFVTGNGVVARALCRSVVVRGARPDRGGGAGGPALLAAGLPYPLDASDTGEGVRRRGRLVGASAGRFVEGAAEGVRVADAVLTGGCGRDRFPHSGSG